MALSVIDMAIEAALLASGKTEYSMTGALAELVQMGLNEIYPRIFKTQTLEQKREASDAATRAIVNAETDAYNKAHFTPEQLEKGRKYRIWINKIIEEGNYTIPYRFGVDDTYVDTRAQSVQDLANRAKLIVKLPTRKIDAKNLKKLKVPVANRTVVKDPLALRKLEMEKLNAETLARAQLRDTRTKEMLENAAEQQAKSLARQQQIQGSANLLSQIQNRASAESANLQQIQNQEQSLIENSEATTAAANAAVLKAEQAQHAKNTIIPVRRLPKSVKYGGGNKSILERLMTEFDMTLKEAKQMIKLYGI